MGGKEGEGGEGWGWRPERERGMGGEGWGCDGCEGWERKAGGVCEVGRGRGDTRWPVWRGEVAAAGRRGC